MWWRLNFKALSQDGGGGIFSKNLRASILMTTHQMSLISAGSISMYSTFKIFFMICFVKFLNFLFCFSFIEAEVDFSRFPETDLVTEGDPLKLYR